MNPIIIVSIVCCVFTALLVIAYFVINKPVKPQAPLVSDAIAKQLMAQQAALTAGPVYTNVWSTQIGYDSNTIIQTLSLDPWTCMATCSGSGGNCVGFQTHSDGQTCDLLNSNVSYTYGFTNPNWNYFQLQKYTPDKAFDVGLPGQCGSGGQVGVTLPKATLAECAEYCSSNTSCTSIEFGSVQGCKMWGQSSTTLVSGCPTGTTIYKLENVQNAIATPPGAPSPSPS